MKKILGLVLAGTLALSSMAAMAADGNKLVVNDNEIATEYITAEDGTVMIPLRAVCEELGYEVNWIEESRTIEIVKMPIYITCSPDFDGYSFSKTAHRPLGKAPVLLEGTTYVPVDFVGEILSGRVYPWEDPYKIFVPDILEHEKLTAFASSVYATEIGENSITVMDFTYGEVIVNVTEETVIEDAEGKAITLADIDPSMQLDVTYGETMTASIPAQTTALRIAMKNETAQVIKEGAVTEIIKDEAGNVTQIILGENEVALNVAAETSVMSADSVVKSLADITVGATLRARTNGMATMSIPAQMPTLEIIIF